MGRDEPGVVLTMSRAANNTARLTPALRVWLETLDRLVVGRRTSGQIGALAMKRGLTEYVCYAADGRLVTYTEEKAIAQLAMRRGEAPHYAPSIGETLTLAGRLALLEARRAERDTD